MTRRVLVFAILLGSLLGSASALAQPQKPLVVASFFPLFEFARHVAGDRAEVVSLVPNGVEPHDWEPAPQDIVRVQRAKLFVYNGAGFEPWVDRILKNLSGQGTLVVRTTEGLSLLRASGRGQEDDAKGKPGAGGGAKKDAKREAAEADPHVWLDPVRAQAQVEAIQAGLAKVDPGNAAAYAANAQAFKAKLAALHAAYESGLERCARRDVVTPHDAFGYLMRRYGLTQVSIQGLAPDAEPSPADLAALARLARQRKVKYVFFETLVSAKLAETLAREIGAQTLILNPVEGLTKEEQAAGKGYLELMEENLKNLRTALECK